MLDKFKFDMDQLEYLNKVLDFGPPLKYHILTTAYTVERISVWVTNVEDRLEALAFKGNQMPSARAEGILYRMTDDEVYELDAQRRVGLDCERKFMQVIIPIRPPIDKSAGFDAQLNPPPYPTIMANVYIARNAAWNGKMANDLTTITDSGKIEKLNFHLASRIVDNDPLFNNRFSVIPPPTLYHPVGFPSPRIVKHVKKRNKSEMRKLWFKNFFRDDDE